MLHIIWQSLIRRWVQSLSTLLAVAISVGILFSLLIMYLGVSQGLETGKKRLGADLLVVPDSVRLDPESALFTGAPLNVYMPLDYLEKTAQIPGVRRVTSQFFTQTLSEDCCSVGDAVRLIGYDPETDWLIGSWLRDGRSGPLGRDEVLIGAKVQGFKGEQAVILNKTFKVAAVLEPAGNSLDYSIIVTLDTARQLAKESPYFNYIWKENGPPENLVSNLLIEVDENHPGEDIVKAVEGTGKLKVISTSEVVNKVRQQMDTIFVVILIGGILISAASFLQLFSRFFSLAWDRKGEWGLYRALGATRADLKLLVVGEAVVLTFAGAVSGIAVGGLLYYCILAFLQEQSAFPYISPPLLTVIAGALGITLVFVSLGVISAWIPARQGGKIDPSLAMSLDDIN
ncbi:MAG: ABC transporter permease [Firmicutes bacterium]|nr:ABC transporter permease [Bacillota bacterium]